MKSLVGRALVEHERFRLSGVSGERCNRLMSRLRLVLVYQQPLQFERTLNRLQNLGHAKRPSFMDQQLSKIRIATFRDATKVCLSS